MDFIRFPADTTNIFPIANSRTGGQLLTEFTLRSRETVGTPQAIEYSVGPSYAHSMRDFYVRRQTDELGVVASDTVIEILDGRAVVNGHFVESLAYVAVDMAEANRMLKEEDQEPLVGKLAIGLRAMYSTEQTLAASLKVENKLDLMAGIQIVILPVVPKNVDLTQMTERKYFVTPEDSPDNEDLVTAHLKLAEFTYANGKIVKDSIIQNKHKIESTQADRIGGFDDVLDKYYVRNDNLNPHGIYTMAGKGEKAGSRPTWCESSDSLFVWQGALTQISAKENKAVTSQAEFGIMDKDGNISVQKVKDESKSLNDDTIVLEIPHKYVPGGMKDSGNNDVFYSPRILHLPQADLYKKTPGTVSRKYTEEVLAIKDKLAEYYHFPFGKQRAYVPILQNQTDDSTEDFTDTSARTTLPPIAKGWLAGDYVVVGQDETVEYDTGSRAPSTLYVVLPPLVNELTLKNGYGTGANSGPVDSVAGTEIARRVVDYTGDSIDNLSIKDGQIVNGDGEVEDIDGSIISDNSFGNQEAYNDYFGISKDNGKWITSLRGAYIRAGESNVIAYGRNDDDLNAAQSSLRTDLYAETNSSDAIVLESRVTTLEDRFYDFQDYATLVVNNVPTIINGKIGTTTRYYYFGVTGIIDGTETYSDAIWLTTPIALATTDLVGGFYNVEEDDLDAGYVYLDETGHLKLLDYDLLRTGVLAYQLGEDRNVNSGSTIEEIQEELDDYVNDRVAFPTQDNINAHKKISEPTDVITITLNAPETVTSGTLVIRNIDSRFSTAVEIVIPETFPAGVTLNIENCQRLKLDVNRLNEGVVAGTAAGPTVNLYNCCLYYDSTAIDYVRSCPRDYESTNTSTQADSTYTTSFTGIENLSLWYERFDTNDPEIVVNGMTVQETHTPLIADADNLKDYWSEEVVNDYHVYTALQSVTFNENGDIIGCGIYVRTDWTSNVEPEFSCVIAAPFTLPAGSVLTYPSSSLVSQIKIAGSFISSYYSVDLTGYLVSKAHFSILTQNTESDGTLACFIETQPVTNVMASIVGDDKSIDAWDPSRYYVFEGYVVDNARK